MYKNISKPVLSNNVSDTFFDWLDYPCFKAWFSVGALYLNDELKISLSELNKLNYIGVRGILSKKNLENDFLSTNRNIDMVPDIGWIFNRYFPDYKKVLINLENKCNIPLQENKYIVFNINSTSIQTHEIERVKNTLNDFAIENDCEVLLVPIKDSEDLLHLSKSKVHMISEPLSLKEIGSLLMGAWFYLGSSLHAAITTMSNNKNAAVIHNVTLTKFQDLFAHSMRLNFWSNNWSDIENILDKLKETPSTSLRKYIDFMSLCIDEKIDDICKEF